MNNLINCILTAALKLILVAIACGLKPPVTQIKTGTIQEVEIQIPSQQEQTTEVEWNLEFVAGDLKLAPRANGYLGRFRAVCIIGSRQYPTLASVTTVFNRDQQSLPFARIIFFLTMLTLLGILEGEILIHGVISHLVFLAAGGRTITIERPRRQRLLSGRASAILQEIWI